MMPLGTAILDHDRQLIRDEKIAEHRRQRELHHAELEARRRERTIPTIR